MAKISARGAKEIDRIDIGKAVYVYTSDGRVLSKIRYSTGESGQYSVLRRKVTPEQWKEWKSNLKGRSDR